MPARRWALERGTSMGLGAERWRKRARSARDRSVGCPARSSCPRASLRFPVGQNSELKLRAVQGLLPLSFVWGASM